MDNHRGKEGNFHERERSKTVNQRGKDAKKTRPESEEQALKNQSIDIERMDDALSNEDLEEIVGGLTTVVVPLCKNCKKRVAVHQMNVCAGCFLKLK